MPFTPFDPTSFRARAGIEFQNDFMARLSDEFPGVEFEMVWDHFKSRDESLTNRELAKLEKEHGDITYVVDGERHFIECCFVLGKKQSRLCEMKRRKFVGENKWYCYGFRDSTDIVLMPSVVWKSYTSQIPKKDRSCRMVPIQSIKNFRAGTGSINEYWNAVHKTEEV